MSGMIGKAMKFARSSQGKKALAKAKSYASSPEGKERIGGVKERMRGRGEKAQPKSGAQPDPGQREPTTATERAPQPDPGSPTS